MTNFDDFTVKNLKLFMEKRNNEILVGLKELRNQVNTSKNLNIKYKIIPYEISIDKIKKLIDSQWVDQEVLNSLDNLKANYKIIWTYKGNNNTIYLKSTIEKYDSFKQRLPVLLNVLNFIYDKKKTNEKRPLKLYLILTPLKKFIDDGIVGTKNINTGYTDFYSNEILIWREEEFEKVIFHEMVHYMDLDVRNMAFSDKDFPIEIDGPKLYFEAFTDFWGIVYHLIYLSIITKKSVDSLFQVEYQFIKNQANFMNNKFKLDDWKNKQKIKQNSPAFSYYILKYLIINKILENKSLDIIINNNAKELLTTIFKEKFTQEPFINTNSGRMTLFQLY